MPTLTFVIRSTVAAMAMLPSLAAAELKSEMEAYVVTTDTSGIEQYVAAVTVDPGQTIEYRLRHINGFDNAIGGVTVTGPVPEGSELLVEQSASDVPATLEVRGEFDPDSAGEEWSMLPAQRIVVNADGSRTIETAQPEHFTAIRWVLQNPMSQGAQVHHTYRVRID